jgi:TrmH family RNA methyltransferase
MASLQTHPSIISSPNHFQIQRIRGLQVRAERERTGLFLIEGIRFVAQAIQHNVKLETLLVAPELLVSPFGQKLVRQQRRAGTPCLTVTPEVFHTVSLSEEPQGIAAVVPQRWEPLPGVTPSEGLCWVALETVHSPGNLGAILRTCDAVGAAGVILLGGAIDPHDPATVRATMGALFAQRFVRTTLPEFLAWKRRHRCLLVGTSPSADADYRSLSCRPPIVLFMGPERRGLSQEQQALCDVVVKIPMVGSSDSLNLAVATSLMLYELFNQRRSP